jgi:hypothetical protein
MDGPPASTLNEGVITPRRIRWEEHIVHMGRKKCIWGFGGETVQKETAQKT